MAVFLPRCIPQLDKNAVILCYHNSIKRISTDGRGIAILRKIVDTSDEDRIFTDVRVSEGDNFQGVIELRMDDPDQTAVFLIKIVKRMIVDI
jgi:hypothetical protein